MKIAFAGFGEVNTPKDIIIKKYNDYKLKKLDEVNETVDYYKPLADCAEKAKFEAIMEQLEIIKEYAKKIHENLFYVLKQQ